MNTGEGQAEINMHTRSMDRSQTTLLLHSECGLRRFKVTVLVKSNTLHIKVFKKAPSDVSTINVRQLLPT